MTVKVSLQTLSMIGLGLVAPKNQVASEMILLHTSRLQEQISVIRTHTITCTYLYVYIKGLNKLSEKKKKKKALYFSITHAHMWSVSALSEKHTLSPYICSFFSFFI